MARKPKETTTEATATRRTERPITRNLDVPLTEQEKLDLGTQVADLTSEIDDRKGQIKSQKEIIAELDGSRTTKAKTRNSGTEIRPVGCTWRINGATVTITRDDTGEVVETRPATEQERQGRFEGWS